MAQAQQRASGLDAHGIQNPARVYWNLSVPAGAHVRRELKMFEADAAPKTVAAGPQPF